jgi:hypothetical protein
MNYRGIEYVIRASLGRNEWSIVISFPEASEPLARSSVVRFHGTREEATLEARKRIRSWLKRQKLKSGAASPGIEKLKSLQHRKAADHRRWRRDRSDRSERYRVTALER